MTNQCLCENVINRVDALVLKKSKLNVLKQAEKYVLFTEQETMLCQFTEHWYKDVMNTLLQGNHSYFGHLSQILLSSWMSEKLNVCIKITGADRFLHGQILYLDCLFTLNCANSVIDRNGVNIRSMQILRPVVAFEWPFFTSLLWLVKLLANLLANHLVVRNSMQQIKCGGRQKFYLDRWRNIFALFGKKWSNSITQLEEIGLRHPEVLIPLLL